MDVDLAVEIAAFADHLRNLLSTEDVLEIIPSYTAIFLEWNVMKTNAGEIELRVLELLREYGSSFSGAEAIVIELPIYYHPEVAPDLEMLAISNGLSVDEVIEIHSAQVYTVASMGFSPGFAYLAGLDTRLATPRLAKPKLVQRGSLGIADDQTGIYPSASPGGWNIIGNCPVTLFDLEKDPMTPFCVGAKVKFSAITKDEFQLANKK